MQEVLALVPPASLSPRQNRPGSLSGRRVRVGLVQHRWHPDPEQCQAEISEGVTRAAGHGAEVIFLPELTLSRYPADTPPEKTPRDLAEDLQNGPTLNFIRKLAAEHDVLMHGSLFRKGEPGSALGYNTAILVSPDGTLLGATDKIHLPVTEGYYEDQYFQPGPQAGSAQEAAAGYPVYSLPLPGHPRIGLPTCWDEWFPELARLYSLGGAEVLAYPTAIGSEPGYPDFDTAPLWQQVIVGNGIANGLFMVVPNRWGHEGLVNFYGSSFISDPYGRILAQAPRSESAVLVAELDLEQRQDWLELFPFLTTRRPDTYSGLCAAPSLRTELTIPGAADA